MPIDKNSVGLYYFIKNIDFVSFADYNKHILKV